MKPVVDETYITELCINIIIYMTRACKTIHMSKHYIIKLVTWQMKRHGSDVLVIQETHLRGTKQFRTDNGKKDIILSGPTGQSYNNKPGQKYAAGVGLILSDRA